MLLTGISLALDRFMQGVARESGVIESDLALGATRWEAARPLISEALRTGMIPTINSMMVMGVVSLPGMMTGQMLAGAAPTAAVRYQIVIIFMIAATTALGTLAVIGLAFRKLFNQSPPSVVCNAAADHRPQQEARDRPRDAHVTAHHNVD